MAALICVFIGLLLGFIILVVFSWSSLASKGDPYTFGKVIEQAWSLGFQRILLGGFYQLNWKIPPGNQALRSEIAKVAPLLLCGLSVGFAFKTGLFNIGAAGQYTIGAFGAYVFALVLGMPWWVCLIASMLFGAVWGAIPGFFKAYFNINEVITSIMFNWIGLYMANTIMYGNGSGVMYNALESKNWKLSIKNPGAIIPDLDVDSSIKFADKSTFVKAFTNPATIGVFIAIAVAIVVFIILNKTVFGYELKACGYSKTAAKYAGINEKRNIILSMAIAGALAGLGAGLYYLTGTEQWNPQENKALPAMGFDGISVALLASSNPIGTIFSAIFKSHIATGGPKMEKTLFPSEIADVISGAIIYLCAFMLLFKNKLAKLLGRLFLSGDAPKGGVK
ncbi:MAG: ABC transporter permease [Clostridiales bacterium]|nr:ABC transporter permease [Clostridiales bacterium]